MVLPTKIPTASVGYLSGPRLRHLLGALSLLRRWAFAEPLFLPFGPLVAALAVISLSEGKAGLWQLGTRMIRWRVRWWVWALALGLPLGVLALSTLLNTQLWGAPTVVWTEVSWSGVAAAFAVRLVNPLDGPMGEEPGWRGYALPRLFSTMSPLVSAAILGLTVTAWHLPLVLMGMLHYLGLPTTFVITFVYCWLFNRAGGSVLITLVFHAAEGSIRLDQLGITGEHISSQTAMYAVVWAIVATVLVLVDRNAWRSPSPSATNPWAVSHVPKPRHHFGAARASAAAARRTIDDGRRLR